MDKFWNTFSKLATDVLQAADDPWKALRWNIAAASAFAIYDKSLDQRALWLGFGLSLIATCAMAAYFVRSYINGLTPKGREDRGFLTVFKLIIRDRFDLLPNKNRAIAVFVSRPNKTDIF